MSPQIELSKKALLLREENGARAPGEGVVRASDLEEEEYLERLKAVRRQREKDKRIQRQKDLAAAGVRRLLSPQECCAIGGFSLPTWNRKYRPFLPVVKISSRRIGVWSDDFDALFATRTAQPDAVPAE